MCLPMSADDAARALDPTALDTRVVRRSFGRAARTYSDAATMQREVSAKAFARLDGVGLRPASILDAGCGTGFALPHMAARFPDARRVALDLAWPMLLVARSDNKFVEGGPVAPGFVCGDISALPFAASAFDLVWSNLAVQWINDLSPAFVELLRVLRPGGLLSFTTIGPATLPELRGAFSNTDEHTHFSRFVDATGIAAMLAVAGFVDCVVESEPFVLTYTDGMAMMRDLRAIGATNATHGRPRGLTGRARWHRMLEALEATPRREGRIPATFEIIYVRARKSQPIATATIAMAAASNGNSVQSATHRCSAESRRVDDGSP